MTDILLLLAAIGLAVATVLAILLLRILRSQSAEHVDRNAVNMAIADDNREMLASSLETDEAEEGDVEVDIALLDDVTHESPQQVHMTNRWAFVATSILIPVIAISLYWYVWGQPGTVLLEEAATYLESEVNEANSRKVAERIQDYISIHPQDHKAWVSLMSFQWLLGDLDGFRKTHKAAELEGHISPFGDSLYLLQAFRQRQLDLTPYDEVVRDRLREVDQGSQVVAMLDAIEHTGRGDFLAANRAWEDVLSQRDVFELHPMAAVGQRATRMRLEEPAHPQIVVSVSLEEIFPDKRWLFVYARTDRNQPPLAVVKRPLSGQRRFDLTLDDSVAMMPNSLLSNAQEVFVTARLSSSEDVLAQSDDLHVTRGPVNSISRPRVALPFGTAKPIVTVKINAEVTMSPLESVFIIVKKRVVSGPPIAVRRIFAPIPRQAIEITLADVMMPTDTAPAMDDLAVSARLARSSSAIARPGDLESATVPFELGATVSLTLDQAVGDVLNN
ncbi:MAG: c-type cytochrome biogenesis protein CcmI [Gammaproteobacteria bacterium]|nr:c-type cytochrome biogenesis protein CcmI [Gammaproteobacteria bacterium]